MNKKPSIFSIISALHSETKLRILAQLIKSKENNVSEIVEELNIERTNISKQLKDLIGLNILLSRKEGRNKYYSFNYDLDKKTKNMIFAIIDAYVACPCSKEKTFKCC